VTCLVIQWSKLLFEVNDISAKSQRKFSMVQLLLDKAVDETSVPHGSGLVLSRRTLYWLLCA
jgi:hypothetical protein